MGRVRKPLKEKMKDDILYGILCGLIASFFVVIAGISIDSTGIIYIWPIALLLMLLNPRYICFAYAGGIVSLSSLLFGFPKVDVPGLIALVGMLHLIESILIWVDGYRDNIPLFIEHKKYGVVGAFSLRKFWPIPLVILVMIATEMPGEAVQMPEWWPLIRPVNMDMVKNPVLMMIPVVAALGYSDIAITENPKATSRAQAVRLGIYSIAVLALAAVSIRIHWVQYIAALAVPLGHEFIIRYSKYLQENRRPMFIPPNIGIMVLDVLPDSYGEKMGLMSGDTILSINGKDVNSEEMLREVLSNYPTFIWVDVIDTEGKARSCECSCYPDGTDNLGIIIVPKYSHNSYKINTMDNYMGRMKSIFRNRDFNV